MSKKVNLLHETLLARDYLSLRRTSACSKLKLQNDLQISRNVCSLITNYLHQLSGFTIQSNLSEDDDSSNNFDESNVVYEAPTYFEKIALGIASTEETVVFEPICRPLLTNFIEKKSYGATIIEMATVSSQVHHGIMDKLISLGIVVKSALQHLRDNPRVKSRTICYYLERFFLYRNGPEVEYDDDIVISILRWMAAILNLVDGDVYIQDFMNLLGLSKFNIVMLYQKVVELSDKMFCFRLELISLERVIELLRVITESKVEEPPETDGIGCFRNLCSLYEQTDLYLSWVDGLSSKTLRSLFGLGKKRIEVAGRDFVKIFKYQVKSIQDGKTTIQVYNKNSSNDRISLSAALQILINSLESKEMNINVTQIPKNDAIHLANRINAPSSISLQRIQRYETIIAILEQKEIMSEASLSSYLRGFTTHLICSKTLNRAYDDLEKNDLIVKDIVELGSYCVLNRSIPIIYLKTLSNISEAKLRFITSYLKPETVIKMVLDCKKTDSHPSTFIIRSKIDYTRFMRYICECPKISAVESLVEYFICLKLWCIDHNNITNIEILEMFNTLRFGKYVMLFGVPKRYTRSQTAEIIISPIETLLVVNIFLAFSCDIPFKQLYLCLSSIDQSAAVELLQYYCERVAMMLSSLEKMGLISLLDGDYESLLLELHESYHSYIAVNTKATAELTNINHEYDAISLWNKFVILLESNQDIEFWFRSCYPNSDVFTRPSSCNVSFVNDLDLPFDHEDPMDPSDSNRLSSKVIGKRKRLNDDDELQGRVEKQSKAFDDEEMCCIAVSTIDHRSLSSERDDDFLMVLLHTILIAFKNCRKTNILPNTIDSDVSIGSGLIMSRLSVTLHHKNALGRLKKRFKSLLNDTLSLQQIIESILFSKSFDELPLLITDRLLRSSIYSKEIKQYEGSDSFTQSIHQVLRFLCEEGLPTNMRDCYTIPMEVFEYLLDSGLVVLRKENLKQEVMSLNENYFDSVCDYFQLMYYHILSKDNHASISEYRTYTEIGNQSSVGLFMKFLFFQALYRKRNELGICSKLVVKQSSSNEDEESCWMSSDHSPSMISLSTRGSFTNITDRISGGMDLMIHDDSNKSNKRPSYDEEMDDCDRLDYIQSSPVCSVEESTFARKILENSKIHDLKPLKPKDDSSSSEIIDCPWTTRNGVNGNILAHYESIMLSILINKPYQTKDSLHRAFPTLTIFQLEELLRVMEYTGNVRCVSSSVQYRLNDPFDSCNRVSKTQSVAYYHANI